MIWSPHIWRLLATRSQHVVISTGSLARSSIQAIVKRLQVTSTASQSIQRRHNLQVGDQIHGYTVERIEDVPELCLSCYGLRHDKTGAEHLHIERPDPNNLFGVSFRTTPNDSTGVAHILEHLALCGSKVFPVRDPFMKMTSRSLATFMNAMTGPDYTMYPFSTLNLKDYENLMKVYLDATFYPNLEYLDFLQEGWRLEHEDPKDPKTDLKLKGVVYNEMKGVFSSAASVYMRGLINQLFTDNTYQYESGGDPKDIPKLTHEQLKQFHARHYHPSNARFITYGNFPLEPQLAAINDYIKDFEPNPSLREQSVVPNQEPWMKPRRVIIEGPPDPMAPISNQQTTVSVSYMLDTVTNTHEVFTLAILGHLLMEGPNSPFYQALIRSNLGADYSPMSGFSNFTKQCIFSIGLQGIHSDDSKKVENIVKETFKKISEEGFDKERIEAVLHMVELSNKHQTSNFGLHLMFGVNTVWNHDGDPVKAMKVNEHIETFRRNLEADPNFLKEKIKQYFLDNKHKLILVMEPNDKINEKNNKAEIRLTHDKIARLTSQDKERIYKEGLELLELQEKKQDSNILPTLEVVDISREKVVTTLEKGVIKGVPIQWSPQPTNGITYFNSVVRIPDDFPSSLRPYIPLFCSVLTKMGAANRDDKQLDQEIQLRTGGLISASHLADDPNELDKYEEGILLQSHALNRNSGAMFSLWSDVMNQVHFRPQNTELLSQLIKVAAAELSQSVTHHGHRYAIKRAAARLNRYSRRKEELDGLSSIAFYKRLAALDEKDELVQVMMILEAISKLLFLPENVRFAVNAESSQERAALSQLETMIGSLSNVKGQDILLPPDSEPESRRSKEVVMEHVVFPFNNFYTSKALVTVPFNDPEFASLRVASKLITSKYLLREVREKGGAYGSGAILGPSGVFSFFSYRDPNVTKTINAYDGAVDWVVEGEGCNTPRDIDEAKLSVFQDVDKPVAPYERGIRYFLTGIDDDAWHQYRLRLLDVKADDIKQAVDKHLRSSTTDSNPARVAVLGPETSETQLIEWVRTEEHDVLLQ